MPPINGAKRVAKHIFYAPSYGVNYAARLTRKHVINPLRNFGADNAFRNTALIGPNGLRLPIENCQLDPVRQNVMRMNGTGSTGSAGSQPSIDIVEAQELIECFYGQQTEMTNADNALTAVKRSKINKRKAIITAGTIATLASAVAGPFIGAALLPIGAPLAAMLGVAFAGIGAVTLGIHYLGSRAKRSLAERVANTDLLSRQDEFINTGKRITGLGAVRGKQEALAKYLAIEGADKKTEILDLFEADSAAKTALENLIAAYEQKEKLAAMDKNNIESDVLEATISILGIISSDLSIHELLSKEIAALAPAELARIFQKTYPVDKDGLVEAYADLESLKQLGEEADVAKQVKRIRSLSESMSFVIQAGPAGEVKDFFLMPSEKESEALIARKNRDEKTFIPIISGAYLVGEGGQADVYKAYNPETGEAVAVKVLRFEGLEDRFKKEYKAMAKVNCPEVVKVYSYGKINGKALIVEELIRYPHLGAHIRKSGGKLSPPEAAEIAMKISAVMDELAQPGVGITHRDLKPENIFYNPETGEIKVSDFGLAKDIEGAEETQTHTAGGTFSYMSPWYILYASTHRAQREREKGKMHDLLVRHDMYAVGVMLYEMVTGKTLTWTSKAEDGSKIMTRIASDKFAGDPAINEEIAWTQYAAGDFLTYWKAKLTKTRAEREKAEIKGKIAAGAQGLEAELEVKKIELESTKRAMNGLKAKYTLVDTYNQEGIVVPQVLMTVISRMTPLDPEETFENGHYEAGQNLSAISKGREIPRATITSGATQFADAFDTQAPKTAAVPPPLPSQAKLEETADITPQHKMKQPAVVDVVAPDVKDPASVRQFLSNANEVLGEAAMGGEPVAAAYVQEVFAIIGEIQSKYEEVEFVQRQIGSIQTTIGDLSVKGEIK